MSEALRQAPKRSLGQNFLTSAAYQKKIVDALFANCRPQTVVEIGPGRGAITQHLLNLPVNLLLIEKDDALAAHWQTQTQEYARLSVWHGDALGWSGSQKIQTPYFIVGNLPYNVATPILLRCLQFTSRPVRLVFMLQKEVAQKCCAAPRHKNYGVLSVACQLLSDIESVCDVPPSAFKPKPNVDSRVLCFTPKPVPNGLDVQKFLEFVKIGFSQRRKMLRGVLASHGLCVPETFASRRAEELSVTQWVELFAAF